MEASPVRKAAEIRGASRPDSHINFPQESLCSSCNRSGKVGRFCNSDIGLSLRGATYGTSDAAVPETRLLRSLHTDYGSR